MSTKDKTTQHDNVVEMKDNGKTDKKEDKKQEAPDMLHLTEEELQRFKLFDAEMTKRLLLLGNTNLTIRLENSEFNQRVGALNNLRDQQQEEVNAYQKMYEEFNRTIMEKRGIKSDKKISIDTETGLIRELPELPRR